MVFRGERGRQARCSSEVAAPAAANTMCRGTAKSRRESTFRITDRDLSNGPSDTECNWFGNVLCCQIALASPGFWFPPPSLLLPFFAPGSYSVFLSVTRFFTFGSYSDEAPNAFFSRPGRAEITFGIRTNSGTSESFFTGRVPRVGLQKLVGLFFS